MKMRKFTMIEIIVAMVVIVILLGLVLGGGVVAGRMAKDSRTRSQITAVETALEQYRIFWGFYPESQSTLAPMPANVGWWDSIGWIPIGVDTNGDGIPDTGKKYLIDNTILGFITDINYGYVDPYGMPFYFQNPGRMNPQKFDFWSMGRDQKHGEAGVDDDGNLTVDDYLDAQTINARDSDDINNWSQ